MLIVDVERRLNAPGFARAKRAITKNSRAPVFARFRSRLFAPLIEVRIGEAAQNEIKSGNNFFLISHRAQSERYPCAKDRIDADPLVLIGPHRFPEATSSRSSPSLRGPLQRQCAPSSRNPES